MALDLMEVRELDPAKVRRVTAGHIEIAPMTDVPVPATIEVRPLCLNLKVPG